MIKEDVYCFDVDNRREERERTIVEVYFCKISKTNVHYNDNLNVCVCVLDKILDFVCTYIIRVANFRVLSSIIDTMSTYEGVTYCIDLNFVLTKKDLKDYTL